LNAFGDAGFVVTNKKNIYEKIKLYRNHGMASRDNVKIFGVNSRLDSLNAEILSYRLKNLKKNIKLRRKNIELYHKYIKTDKVTLPVDSKDSYSSYVMMISKCENRDKLQKHLSKNNIQSLVYYGTPLHLHKSFKSLKRDFKNLKNAERLSKKVLSFPHHQYLNEKHIKYISQCINNFYE